MFLETFNFMYDWLFSGGIPPLIANIPNLAEWLSFGLSCACILFCLIVVSLPIICIFKFILRWFE